MRFIHSLRYALRGLAVLLRKEKNFRTQSVIACIVIAAGFTLDISRTDWVVVLICIAVVLSLEGMNTAIERILDKMYPDHDPEIGKIKDIAAGAVLLSAAISAVIGMIVFWKYL